MAIKATTLRQNLYQLLDSILETGKSLEVERNGKILRIVAAESSSKFEQLEAHSALVGKAEDLLNLDWSSLWNELPITKKASKGRNKHE